MALLRSLLLLALAALAASFSLSAPPSAALAASAVELRVPTEAITMGRGDKRTAKGKRKRGSFGNSRPRNAELRKRKAAAESASEE